MLTFLPKSMFWDSEYLGTISFIQKSIYLLGMLLGVRDRAVNKMGVNPYPHGSYISVVGKQLVN